MDLNQVTIPSNDVEKSILFYLMLGHKLIVKSLPNYARFECSQGDCTFSLHYTPNIISGEGMWLYFEVANVDEVIQKLIELKITINAFPEDKSWLWREANLFDPFGNKIIIYSAGTNRKNPPWRVK